MATDIPDWTQSVTIESGTVTVKGAVDATITSGTVDATITNASVPISGSVSISSGTVDISAGTVDVQNAAGTVIATGAALDFLKGAIVGGSTQRCVLTIAGTLVKKSYAALLVAVYTSSAGTPLAVSAWDATDKSSHTWSPTFCAPMTKGPTPGAKYVGIVPFANEPGDAITVEVWSTLAGPGFDIAVYGLTRNPGVQLRSDGRAYPMGSFRATLTFTGPAIKTLVAAPPAPLRVLVLSASVAIASHGTSDYLMMGATGEPLFLAVAGTPSGGTAASVAPPGGILLPPHTALALNMQTTSITTRAVAAAAYDLVA